MSNTNRDPHEPPPILLDYAQLVELRKMGVVQCHTTPLLEALRTIADVARDSAGVKKPGALVEVGQQLSGLVPYGYENHFKPPLSVEQLCMIMDGSESIAYVRRVRPRAISDMILADLKRIAEHYS